MCRHYSFTSFISCFASRYQFVLMMIFGISATTNSTSTTRFLSSSAYRHSSHQPPTQPLLQSTSTTSPSADDCPSESPLTCSNWILCASSTRCGTVLDAISGTRGRSAPKEGNNQRQRWWRSVVCWTTSKWNSQSANDSATHRHSSTDLVISLFKIMFHSSFLFYLGSVAGVGVSFQPFDTILSLRLLLLTQPSLLCIGCEWCAKSWGNKSSGGVSSYGEARANEGRTTRNHLYSVSLPTHLMLEVMFFLYITACVEK